MRNNNQILHGDQTRCEENSIGSTSVILVNYNYITLLAVAKIFSDKNADARYLCDIANLVICGYSSVKLECKFVFFCNQHFDSRY